MPIWFELIAVLLVAYGTGIAIGWALWGREVAEPAGEEKDSE